MAERDVCGRAALHTPPEWQNEQDTQSKEMEIHPTLEMDIAVKEAERKGKPVRGASTITNQCARSIFLWQGRSWIRKGLESYPKRRILKLYATVIEMGRGIYGIGSRLAALLRCQRARSHAGAVSDARGGPAKSETRNRAPPYGDGSNAFSCGNRTQTFRRSSFTESLINADASGALPPRTLDKEDYGFKDEAALLTRETISPINKVWL